MFTETQLVSLLTAIRGQEPRRTEWDIEPQGGSGSDRQFFKVRPVRDAGVGESQHYCAIVPASSDPRDLQEARSSWRIGTHLFDHQVPVPQIFGYHEPSGLLVFEHLGKQHLHDFLTSGPADPADLKSLYREVIDVLIRLQCVAREGFQADFCFDTARYDRTLMIRKESEYFLREFCIGMMEVREIPAAIGGELNQLADRASCESSAFVMHRDFQSRNIMIHASRIRIIDFQGARFGPLAYDLASLLIDPYASLSQEFQEEMFAYYLSTVKRFDSIDPDAFSEGYFYLALQRNLQILGAFAFLSEEKNKPFFRRYIRPALATLQNRLNTSEGDRFPGLRKLVSDCSRLLEHKSQGSLSRSKK
ncbi:aminoglycoside phosphotransferase family protein [Thermodesulfobacteriota bacterium]